MAYILAENEMIVQYPFTRSDLLAAHPNVSFPFNLTAEDLEPFGVYILAESLKPEDTREMRAVELEPQLIDGVWTQVWDMREATAEELAEFDALHAPQPDWLAFAVELISSSSISSFLDMLPAGVANGLSIGLSEASKGDTRIFLQLWQRVLAAGVISTSIIEEMAVFAIQYNLPMDFIAALAPAGE